MNAHKSPTTWEAAREALITHARVFAAVAGTEPDGRLGEIQALVEQARQLDDAELQDFIHDVASGIGSKVNNACEEAEFLIEQYGFEQAQAEIRGLVERLAAAASKPEFPNPALQTSATPSETEPKE